MKFITFFETQYDQNEANTSCYDCVYTVLMQNVEATDFVFAPNAYGEANVNK